jgi:hypothetical protein
MGMVRVQQPIEGLAIPVEPELNAGAKPFGHTLERQVRGAAPAPALDAADDGTGDARDPSKIGLPPVAPSPQGANGSAKSNEVHGWPWSRQALAHRLPAGTAT